MIGNAENEIYQIARQFSFISSVETILKTLNVLKVKLTITPTCFVQIYQNTKKGVVNYTLVSGNQRLFGRDCDGGQWHCHPLDNPEEHDFSEEGTKAISLEDFLYEAEEKLSTIGIL
jgi:hypothetical protein